MAFLLKNYQSLMEKKTKRGCLLDVMYMIQAQGEILNAVNIFFLWVYYQDVFSGQ